MLLQMGPLLHLGPVITLVPSTAFLPEGFENNSKGFGPATIWRGAAIHSLAVFSKMKIL